MASPWQMIDADDPVVGDLLAATLELVAEAGGWVHPDARLTARAGQLTIACDARDGPLARIPREAMVRVDQITWEDDPDRLTIEGLPEDVGDIELQMLYTQVALHNQCDKLPWLRRTHPAIAEDLSPDVIEAVRAVVPGFRAQSMTAADLLFANRCFRVDLGDGQGSQRLLVPVIDLINHHRNGAVADWTGAAFEVAARKPWGTGECALDYGMDRDPMEMAVVYGFVDDSSRSGGDQAAADVAQLLEVIRACDQHPSPAADIIKAAAVRSLPRLAAIKNTPPDG